MSVLSENTPEARAGEQVIGSLTIGKQQKGRVFVQRGETPEVMSVPETILNAVPLDPEAWISPGSRFKELFTTENTEAQGALLSINGPSSGGRFSAALIISRQIRCEAIGFGGHNEVVTVQATNFMRPPGYRDAAPLRENCRMMAFGLRKRTDLVCQIEGLDKVLEAKGTLQSGNSIALNDLPVGDL